MNMSNNLESPQAVSTFIQELRRLGVVMTADGDRLHVSAPIGVVDAEMAARISALKSVILQHLTVQSRSELTAIPPVARDQPLPLGVVQQRMWLHSKMELDTVLYNLPAAWRLHGSLDLEAFSAAFDAIIARHEVLRVSIRMDDEAPSQCFGPCRSRTLVVEDLGAIPDDQREQVLFAKLHALRDAAIDLEAGQPYQACLFRIGPQEHVFFLMPHHVVWDGWSFDIFLRDIDAFYSAAIAGREPNLPALPIQYADFAVWHRDWLASGINHEHLAFWTKALAGELRPLELPLDHPRPPQFSHRGNWEEFSISASVVECISQLATRHQGTPFMVFLAAWIAFVYRITGETDLVVGIPIQARQTVEVSDLIGCFVNTLCIRQTLDPTASFSALLSSVRNSSIDAYEHQDAPFEMLLEQLAIRRDPSRTPLFQTMFSHQQVGRRVDRIGPLSLSQLHVNPASTPTDLMFAVMEGKQGARAVIHYSSDLFDAQTIHALRQRFERFLDAALAAPDTAVSELALLPDPERETLASWNQTLVPYPRDLSIHALIEAQTDRAPSRIALRSDGSVLSYAALDVRANRLACLMRSRGVGSGSMVGLCVARDFDMVVCVLAVLKAGGAYLPLDPAFPRDRLAFMVADSGLSLLVTHSELATHVDWPRDCSIWLDDDAVLIEAQSSTRIEPDATASPESVAYVLYTSGSTGKPKGVQVPHRAVVNFLTSMAREPGLSKDDRLLAVTTLSFDIAVLELLLPLTVGAEIVIARRDQVTDGDALKALILHMGITVMQATPTAWRLLTEAGWQASPGFRALVGGEALPLDLAQRLLVMGCETWNMYGPTETTIWSTCWRVLGLENGISIGRPIANTSVHILDQNRQLCPINVPGEIYIGGEGLALGYLGLPELTAERFVADPFAADPETRLYRTGDRGRWRADGKLEHMGRLDFQVKVRGYRVELGEIESALLGHPDIANAVATVREDRPGDVRLVAYLVAAGDIAPEDAQLLNHLRQSLPGYMIPQHFVQLDAIPLLPNGKIDRKALPLPSAPLVTVEAERVAPRDQLEACISDIMEQVLGVSELGIHEDFFAAGGHSLSAARLTSRINHGMGLGLTLRTLFDGPTVAQLAQVIRDTRHSGVAPCQPISHRIEQDRAPLSLQQEALWLHEQFDADHVALNLPASYRLVGPMDVSAMDRAFAEVVRRQPSLRTRICQQGETIFQVVADAVEGTVLPLVDLSALSAQEREAELASQLGASAATPFDLAKEPLFRARLYRLADDEHVLMFVVHHIIWDGWSFGLLFDEVAELYEAFSTGRASQLKSLDVTYTDFAAWQSEWSKTESARAEVAHWAEALSPQPEPIELPNDHSRPPVMSGQGEHLRFEISEHTTQKVRELGQRQSATVFMTLFAAYTALLYRITGQDDLVIGTPLRGRKSAELEPIMGLFRNTLPLRVRVASGWTFSDLVGDIRSRMLDAFSRPDVPFQNLVRSLGAIRDFSRHPIYQVFFSFQDVRARKAQWGQLRHKRGGLHAKGVTEDLGLWLVETSDGLTGGVSYSADILSRESAQRIVEQFVQLLDSALASPDRPLATLELLPQSERLMLASWNPPVTPYPRELPIHALIEAQTDRAPSRIALRSDGSVLDYAALDARANRLARLLRSRGVGSGSMVGLCVPRDFDMVVCVLAVLKAGGTYLPLDPAFPRDRLAFMVEDSGLSLLVTHSELAARVDWPRDRSIWLDADAALIDAQSAARIEPDATASPESVAYVLYTSGSTGKPKGVQVPHRAVVNFLTSMAREPGLAADDRLVAVTTLSFDIAALELFLPLTVGAEVVLASREQASDGHALKALIDSTNVTVMQATPTTWRILIEAGWQGGPAFRALVGGEALPLDLAQRLIAMGCETWNMYGPTETTIWSTCWRVQAPEQSISIGRPIANTAVFILDQNRQLCPINVPGEICIGGEGVTLGYLGRPELTAERFVADPFSDAPTARLYRTGDRGRWRADGTLEHLGRLDFQVKVRGYRIELGEVESALLAYPDIVNAVAMVREDRPGDIQIVGYVVTKRRAVAAKELREHLRAQLPDFMVPQHYVIVESIPLLPNGKVDRKSLPPPSRMLSSAAEHIDRNFDKRVQDPRVALLQKIWIDTLGVMAGPDDNFFELGGDSMQALRMIMKVENSVGVRFNLIKLATGTMYSLAEELPEQSTRKKTERGFRALVNRVFGRKA